MELHMMLNDPWEASIAFPLDDTDLWSLVEDDLKHPCIEDELAEKKPFENVALKIEPPNSPAFPDEEEEPFSATWLEKKIDLTVFDNISADVSEGLLYGRFPPNRAPPPASNALAEEVKQPIKGEGQTVHRTDDLLKEFGMVLEEVGAGLTPPNSPPQYQVQSNGFAPSVIPVAQDAMHLANEMATIDELVRERAEEALVSSPLITVLSRQSSYPPPTPPPVTSESIFDCFKTQAIPAPPASAFLSDQQPQWIEVTVCNPAGLIIPSPAPPSPAYSLEPQTPPSMTPLSPVMTTVTLPVMEQVAPSTSAHSLMNNSMPPTPATSSASSPPPSPMSSIDDSDPDWQPSSVEPLTTKLPSPRKIRASKSKPYQKQRHQSRTRVSVDNVEEKRLRKKEQNKNAATRYRMKKKAQAEGLSKEEQDLHDTNATLREKTTDVKREIRYLKGLMRDLFKAKGILK